MAAAWLGLLSPLRSWSPSYKMGSGQLLLPRWKTILTFTFRDSFGLLLPTIADHFNVGRAEASLTSSFMTLLTLGSGETCLIVP